MTRTQRLTLGHPYNVGPRSASPPCAVDRPQAGGHSVCRTYGVTGKETACLRFPESSLATSRHRASLTVADESNHEMLLAQVKGPQQSSDPRWNGATITYSAVLDLANGKGMQRGHFVNAHADGHQSFGSFEGPVAPAGGELRCDGAWTATGA